MRIGGSVTRQIREAGRGVASENLGQATLYGQAIGDVAASGKLGSG